VLGNVGTTLFSSAGACALRPGLADPYAPLMAYLHATNETVPVLALIIQVGALHLGRHYCDQRLCVGPRHLADLARRRLAASPRDHHAAALGTGARRSTGPASDKRTGGGRITLPIEGRGGQRPARRHLLRINPPLLVIFSR
jgi:hypothetical protein